MSVNVGCIGRGCKRASQNIKSQGHLTCSMGANIYQWFAPYWLQVPTKSSIMHVWILTMPPKQTFWLVNLAMINWNNFVSEIAVLPASVFKKQKCFFVLFFHGSVFFVVEKCFLVIFFFKMCFFFFYHAGDSRVLQFNITIYRFLSD